MSQGLSGSERETVFEKLERRKASYTDTVADWKYERKNRSSAFEAPLEIHVTSTIQLTSHVFLISTSLPLMTPLLYFPYFSPQDAAIG